MFSVSSFSSCNLSRDNSCPFWQMDNRPLVEWGNPSNVIVGWTRKAFSTQKNQNRSNQKWFNKTKISSHLIWNTSTRTDGNEFTFNSDMKSTIRTSLFSAEFCSLNCQIEKSQSIVRFKIISTKKCRFGILFSSVEALLALSLWRFTSTIESWFRCFSVDVSPFNKKCTNICALLKAKQKKNNEKKIEVWKLRIRVEARTVLFVDCSWMFDWNFLIEICWDVHVTTVGHINFYILRRHCKYASCNRIKLFMSFIMLLRC